MNGLELKKLLKLNMLTQQEAADLFGIRRETLDALLLGVGDEHLPKMVVAHQTDQLHHPLVVELVKDVVQQQNGLVTDLLVVVLKLRQTDGNHKGFLLPLRAKLLQRMPVEIEFQIVLVDAYIGVTGTGILLKILFK